MAEGPTADYYGAMLSGDRLRQCYEVAPPRVQQYLDAEIGFVLSMLEPGDAVLEVGCGYGRVCLRLADLAKRIVGVDTSSESLSLARALAGAGSKCEFLKMDASALAFVDGEFDAVVCVQNGICAFGVDRAGLVREALRVTHPGGRALFSTYASGFWRHRLEWFEAQAHAGLIGELDGELTGAGTIVCKDGLRLGALGPEDFHELGEVVGVSPEITEVDGSSLFAVWEVPVPSN
jgi:SAM-dependent methyltransferase